jgi:DNA-binding MarR family transcriptional regulator
MRIADVALAVHRNEEMTTRAIEKLSERGLVEVSADADGNLQLQHTDESRRN